MGTGATMAKYAAEGAQVTLVTCTLGEEGEILLPKLSQLAADQADQLGGYRIGELRAACAALGVTDHRFLGGPGHYRDSGMMGTPANKHPRSFWGANLRTAAEELVPVIREVRPQVVVTYDPNGFYGHPDHIQAHRVAMEGVRLAADPDVLPESEAWAVSKVYWTAMPKSALQKGIEAFADSAENPFAGVTDVDQLPFGTPDAEIAACIDASSYEDAKVAALRAHGSQIDAESWIFSLAGNAQGDFGVEFYVLAEGKRGPGEGEYDYETDLFAGLD